MTGSKEFWITNPILQQTYNILDTPQVITVGTSACSVGPFSSIHSFVTLPRTNGSQLKPTMIEFLIKPLSDAAFFEALATYAGLVLAELVSLSNNNHPSQEGLALIHTTPNPTPLSLAFFQGNEIRP